MAGTRICGSCAKRRAKLANLKARKAREGKPVQAATLGAVLAVSEAAGKALGIDDHGEVEDGSGTDPSPEPDSGSTGIAG